MAGKPLYDMVVVLPGITGSVLEKDGKDLWAISGQAAWRALRTLGDSLQELALDGDDPSGIVATRLMPDAHVVPGLVKIDGYSATVAMVADTFDIVRGSVDDDKPANFIEFPYDWRLDNRVNARRLAELVSDRLARWREYSHNPGAKTIFLAHSMGGLIARYHLEALEGWRDCRALVTFGTPHRGSLNAVNFLANGYKKLFVDLTEVMRTFPSMYQLLPIYRALRTGQDYVRVAETKGIPGIDQARAQDALAFHREIERKVQDHRTDAEYLDGGYAIIPVVGTRQPTLQSAVLTDKSLTVTEDLPGWMDPSLADGDGTVPRASAIPIEMSDAYRDSYAAEKHSSLHCNRTVLEDIRGRLEQMQVRGLREIRGPSESSAAGERPALALDVEDLYLEDEPVVLSARLVNSEQSAGGLRGHVEPIDAPASFAPRSVDFSESANGWMCLLEDLPPGLYRVEVRTEKAGPSAPPPVHDLIEVAGAV
jgi:pimeloyl-ACP methyl ester carboxylesterase